MMAEQADRDINFTYMGGDRDVVPRNATHVRVHKSVKVIPSRAFFRHPNLVEFECHDGVDTIEGEAFEECPSLKRVKMPGVKIVEDHAFAWCNALTDVDCDKLETIGRSAFFWCKSLRSMNMPSVKTVEGRAFLGCTNLVDVTFGDKLESIGGCALCDCHALKRITIPLKDGIVLSLIAHGDVFRRCRSLSSVDLVGGIHKTIAALHLEEWRGDMKAEIGRINQILPTTDAGTPGTLNVGHKAEAVLMWITSVLHKIEDNKAKHRTLLKDASTTLELALWKSRLGGDDNDGPAEGDKEGRTECRNNCGADMSIVIPNVMSFLKIE